MFHGALMVVAEGFDQIGVRQEPQLNDSRPRFPVGFRIVDRDRQIHVAEILPMEPILIGDLIQEYNDLSADGFRVLAVASKSVDKRAAYSKADESGLILKGYIAFLDPPKETAAKAITALQNNGVAVKVLTGDNDLVTRKVCKEVGLDAHVAVRAAFHARHAAAVNPIHSGAKALKNRVVGCFRSHLKSRAYLDQNFHCGRRG